MASATTDMTFAKGLVVAAISGMAVDANHQSCGSLSSGGRGLNWLRILRQRDGLAAAAAAEAFEASGWLDRLDGLDGLDGLVMSSFSPALRSFRGELLRGFHCGGSRA